MWCPGCLLRGPVLLMWWSAAKGTLMLPLRLGRNCMISPPAPRGEPLHYPCSNSLWRQQEGRSGLMRGEGGGLRTVWMCVEGSGALGGCGGDYRTLKCFLCSFEETREMFHTNINWQTEAWGGWPPFLPFPPLSLSLFAHLPKLTHTHTASIKPEQQDTHIHILSRKIWNYFSNCGSAGPRVSHSVNKKIFPFS